MVYVTLEPCLMCLGAAMHARVSRVVYGARDLRVGAIERLEALRSSGAGFNHRFESVGGILAEEAAGLLLGFFHERRGLARAESADPVETIFGEVPKWS